MVGRNGLTRDALVGIFADTGVDNPVSHLATGNISFGQTQVSTEFSERIEQAIAAVSGTYPGGSPLSGSQDSSEVHVLRLRPISRR